MKREKVIMSTIFYIQDERNVNDYDGYDVSLTPYLGYAKRKEGVFYYKSFYISFLYWSFVWAKRYYYN